MENETILRKNCEAIPLKFDQCPRTLQRFLESIKWDEEGDELLGACGSGGAEIGDFRHDGARPHRAMIRARRRQAPPGRQLGRGRRPRQGL